MSSISSINSSTMSGMQRMQRPDPSKMTENLFSKLDTSGKGYLEKSDLQSAFAQLSSTSSSSSSSSTTSSSASVDDVFKSLDSDSDGKITKDEMTSGLQKIADQLDSQFNKMREGGKAGGGMQGAGGMPPPPPPDGANSAGITKDQLTSMAKEIGSNDSTASSKISDLVKNFDKADTDKDGKISAKEAIAYDQANSTSSSTSTSSTSASTSNSSSTSSTSDSGKLETQIMKQIMELMRAYGGSGSDSGVSSLLSTLSTSA